MNLFYAVQPEGWREKVASVMQAYPAYRWEADIVLDPDWVVYEDFLYPGGKDMQSIRHRRGFRQWHEDRGDSPRLAAVMEHWLGFASDSDRTAFCDEATAWGFTVEEFVASPATALPMTLRRRSSNARRDAMAACVRERPGHEPRHCAMTAGQDLCEIPPRSLIFDPTPERPARVPMFTRPSRSVIFRVRLSRKDAPDYMDQVSLELAELAGRYNGEYNGWGWRLIS